MSAARLLRLWSTGIWVGNEVWGLVRAHPWAGPLLGCPAGRLGARWNLSVPQFPLGTHEGPFLSLTPRHRADSGPGGQL